MKNLFSLFFSLFFSFTLFSQTGKIAGKVVDATSGEPLIGASVAIKDSKFGGITDVNGAYSMNKIPVGTYTLVINYLSYSTKEIPGIVVNTDKITFQNITLEKKSASMGGVSIETKVQRDNINTLILEQKNAPTVRDGISADAIRRTPDRNTGDVLKRVSGAAIQDNRFAIIRGLNDRYNAAFLNGAPLPSTESDRKAFSFDLFPSNVLDNLTISKTASPDQTGEFGGGIINLTTKGVPAENFQSISYSSGYNSIATFQKQVTYQGGKLDWLGLDDGTRSLPSDFPAYKTFPTDKDGQFAAAKQLPNNWDLINGRFSPNSSFQGVAGGNIKRNDKDFFGYIISASHQRNYNRASSLRYSWSLDPDSNRIVGKAMDTAYSSNVLAGGLANFALNLNPNNTISWKNVYSITSEDQVITRNGIGAYNEEEKIYAQNAARWFTSNKIFSSQLMGDHYWKSAKIKINWVTSFSNINRNIPSLRRSSYAYAYDPSDPTNGTWIANVTGVAGFNSNDMGSYFFSETNEEVNSSQLNLQRAMNITKEIKNTMKVGVFNQNRMRDFNSRNLQFIKSSMTKYDNSLSGLGLDSIFMVSHMSDSGFRLTQASRPFDQYRAQSNLSAAYWMNDTRFSDAIRVVWGFRGESYRQELSSTKDNLNPVNIDTTVVDLLPSVNGVFAINKKQNLRLSYSKTLNRPEFRELMPFVFVDFNTRFVISGNEELERATIQNYDFRYEIFPGNGQLFSVSAFYKNFTNPIEQYVLPGVSSSDGLQVSYRNQETAKNLGFETEFRLVLGKINGNEIENVWDKFTVFSNLALIRSQVNVKYNDTATATITRQLQGQSPYVFNGGVTYWDEAKKFNVSLMANRVGQRISVVGSVNQFGNEDEPTLWENGRTVIDLSLTKSFLKEKLEVRLTGRDLLAQRQYFYWDLNGNGKLDSDAGGYGEITQTKATLVDRVVDPITGYEIVPTGSAPRDVVRWSTVFGRTVNVQLTYKF